MRVDPLSLRGAERRSNLNSFNSLPARRQKRGLCQINKHRPHPKTNQTGRMYEHLPFTALLSYGISRISSKYIIPAPVVPATPFVPTPIVIVLTFVISVLNAARSITHSCQMGVCVAAGSSLYTTAVPLRATKMRSASLPGELMNHRLSFVTPWAVQSRGKASVSVA